MSATTTFIHLTDLHIGPPTPPDPHLHSDTTATLRTVLAQIAGVTPRPAFIVASGDLTNRGDAQSFAHLRAEMAATDLPVVYALGNHDTRAGYYRGMLGREHDLDAPYDHDQLLAGVHVITLDTSTPGRIHGTLEPGQFAWLEDALGRHPDAPKLIVAHHPPALGDEPDPTPWRTIEFAQSQRLAGLLAGRPILAILSGHIHHDRVSLWRGVPVVVGAGLHAATDFLTTTELRVVAGASFGLCTVRPSGLTVAFAPLPSDRRELHRVSYERMLAAHDGVAAA